MVTLPNWRMADRIVNILQHDDQATAKKKKRIIITVTLFNDNTYPN